MRKKDKKLVISLIGGLLIVLLSLGGWLGLMRFILHKKTEITNDYLRAEELRSQLERSNFLKESLRKIKDKKERVEVLALDKSSLVDFIERVEGLAEEAKVELEIGGIEEIFQKGKSAPQGLRLSMRLEGSFGGIHRYIKFLENLAYPIVFKRAYVQKGNKSWSANLEIILPTYGIGLSK